MSTVRVYHPSLDAWEDISEADKDSWKDAGWRMTKPAHVDESEAPPVGESPRPADIPREAVEDAAPGDVVTTPKRRAPRPRKAAAKPAVAPAVAPTLDADATQ